SRRREGARARARPAAGRSGAGAGGGRARPGAGPEGLRERRDGAALPRALHQRGGPRVITCALLAIALLAYTYVGYPVAIGLLAGLRPWSPKAPADAGAAPKPKVTVCLPVYNGASYLPAKIRSIFAQDYPADRFEILVYNDCSGDDSERIARDLAASPEAAGPL